MSDRARKPALETWAWFVLALLAVLLVGGGSWFLLTERAAHRQNVEEGLEIIAELKAEQIAEWRAERLAGAAVVVDRRDVREDLESFFADSEGSAKALLDRALSSVLQQFQYKEILVLDAQVETRMVVGEPTVLCDEGCREAVQMAASSGKSVWTPIHDDSDSATPHLSVVAPVLVWPDGQRLVGYLVLVADAADFLYPLIQRWPIPSETAESLLVRRDGSDVLFLNDLRHHDDAALRLRIPTTRSDLPAAMAVAGKTGVVYGRDYRDVPVVAAVVPVEGSPWFLVAKVDIREAFAGWRVRMLLLGLLLAGGVTLIGALWLVVRQRHLKSHFEALYRSELALRKAFELKEAIVAASPIGIVIYDADGDCIAANEAAARMAGATPDQVLQQNFHQIESWRVSGVYEAAIRSLHEGDRQRIQTDLTTTFGKHVALELDLVAVDLAGEQHLLVMVDDVTERDAGERALRASEERYRVLIENAEVLVSMYDRSGTCLLVNRKVADQFGATPEQMIGQSIVDLHPGASEEYLGRIHDVIDSASARSYEDVVRFPQGDRHLLSNVQPVRDAAGTVYAAQIISHDVTDLRQLEEQLVHSQKMEAIGRLAGGVAHDFNNMLGVIIGRTELLLSRTDPEDPISAGLREVEKAAHRSADLTRQLLAFARRQTVAPKVMDLNQTVEGMLQMLRRLIGEGIDLVWQPDSGLWPVKIDPAQLDQVLANLCVNARDAMSGTGKVAIETRNAELDERYCLRFPEHAPGSYVMLAVSDTGCGMDEATREHIFEPFFTTKESGHGTGLGLSTVYGIVTQNGGVVSVYSEPGQGTTFKIYIPRHVGDGPADETMAEVVVPPAQGETVLLVEDEVGLLEGTAEVLEELGYTVLTASSPDQALSLAQATDDTIHLLVTDVVMPKMNGRQLADRLQEVRAGVRVLFMSGYTANAIAHNGVLDEGVHFLQKPFSLHELAVHVRQALED